MAGATNTELKNLLDIIYGKLEKLEDRLVDVEKRLPPTYVNSIETAICELKSMAASIEQGPDVAQNLDDITSILGLLGKGIADLEARFIEATPMRGTDGALTTLLPAQKQLEEVLELLELFNVSLDKIKTSLQLAPKPGKMRGTDNAITSLEPAQKQLEKALEALSILVTSVGGIKTELSKPTPKLEKMRGTDGALTSLGPVQAELEGIGKMLNGITTSIGSIMTDVGKPIPKLIPMRGTDGAVTSLEPVLDVIGKLRSDFTEVVGSAMAGVKAPGVKPAPDVSPILTTIEKKLGEIEERLREFSAPSAGPQSSELVKETLAEFGIWADKFDKTAAMHTELLMEIKGEPELAEDNSVVVANETLLIYGPSPGQPDFPMSMRNFHKGEDVGVYTTFIGDIDLKNCELRIMYKDAIINKLKAQSTKYINLVRFKLPKAITSTLRLMHYDYEIWLNVNDRNYVADKGSFNVLGP